MFAPVDVGSSDLRFGMTAIFARKFPWAYRRYPSRKGARVASASKAMGMAATPMGFNQMCSVWVRLVRKKAGKGI
ncbi:hypothetical protein C1Y26_10445 [Pseudomonas sp. MPR-R2A7]|nr:hypothetical protein C1Y23_15915 [Pseudomonas sp. GW460-12]PMX34818.1 hypothetical protein C1Y24_12030 [Pseudomonas sp. MPR-R2A4]PMX41457.1 hypothetical protein C1Y26_10445 [Pseudomonas sp. MPR-R2A7]PMX53974.1 hypothetical protein C1Y17_10640 [Pseudomonas sp. MPR-R2A6]PMX90935.1 hypothetical protein C1Y21_13565 [Pseudomonas sp. MPR-R2A3]PMY13436.1 hypothetical protein C1Y22_12140 [Pseudomonas sp. MPR-R2A5]PNA34710.1 hypothetical protein C1Y16_11795 [Pseudomonas sp. MPR-ANB1]PNA47964.1 hyp